MITVIQLARTDDEPAGHRLSPSMSSFLSRSFAIDRMVVGNSRVRLSGQLAPGPWAKSPNVLLKALVNSLQMESVIIGNPGSGVMREKPM